MLCALLVCAVGTGCSTSLVPPNEPGAQDVFVEFEREPVVAEVPPDWSGVLDIELYGYRTDGWPCIEVVPEGSRYPSLSSITTERDLVGTYLIAPERRRALAPFFESTSSTYRYYACPGGNSPKQIVIRWKDRAEAEAEWRAEDEMKVIPEPAALKRMELPE